MANSARGKNGKFTRSIETAAKDAEAARLRARGHSYREISEALGYEDESGSYRAVQRALVQVVAEPAEEVRRLQLDQLDRLALAALGVLERAHVTVSQGRVVRDEAGAPIEDDGPVLTAIDRLLKIQERRAKLLGLDSPARQVVSFDAIDAEIERLTAELGGDPAREAAAPEVTPAGGGEAPG